MVGFQVGNEPQATLRLFGQRGEQHAVPVDVLVQSLTGMQKLIYLFAYDSKGKRLNKKLRVTDEIADKYKLVCMVPEKGSYAIPLRIATPAGQLFQLPEVKDLLNQVQSFFEALASTDSKKAREQFKDSTLYRRALQEVRTFIPKADDTWSIGFSLQGGASESVLGRNVSKAISEWTLSGDSSDSITTITGELTGIFFDERKVVVKYHPTQREIDCLYDEDLEELMIENRRQLIQVTGRFTLNSDGHPIKLTDVSNLEPLDLSPITLDEFDYNGKTFRFKETLSLQVELDDTEQVLLCAKDDLGIDVFAITRDELVSGLEQQIEFLWKEYVQDEHSMFSDDASRLRKNLLAALEVFDAA